MAAVEHRMDDLTKKVPKAFMIVPVNALVSAHNVVVIYWERTLIDSSSIPEQLGFTLTIGVHFPIVKHDSI